MKAVLAVLILAGMASSTCLEYRLDMWNRYGDQVKAWYKHGPSIISFMYTGDRIRVPSFIWYDEDKHEFCKR